jgi:hypothetical protein
VGQPAPPLFAQLTYTGTGRLIGRWEVVMPGEEPPTAFDLLPEASLPVEDRVRQKRYLQLSRFNVQLPPLGRFRLEGPDASKLPTAVEGLYHVLLRIEASSDFDGNTDLADVGSGSGVVSTGGVAGFPLPVLRYYVGSADTKSVALVLPASDARVSAGSPIQFEWRPVGVAAFYRLELKESAGTSVLAAIVEAPTTTYRSPPLAGELLVAGKLTWTVIALDERGKEVARSTEGTFQYGESPDVQ